MVIPEPLSAGFMVIVGSCMRSLRAVCWSRVRFLPYWCGCRLSRRRSRASSVSSTGRGQGGGMVFLASFLCRKWNLLRSVYGLLFSVVMRGYFFRQMLM